MKVISAAKNEIVIQFRRTEIGFINNALNETLGALEDWEFQTRTGWTRQEATKLSDEVNDSIDLIPKR